MSTFKNSIFKKEIHVVSAVLVISALIYTVYAVNSRQTVAPQNLKAAACKTDECSTATGCQLPGFMLDGFKCAGQNQWESPQGEIVPGGPDGPIPTPAAAAETNLEIAKRVLDWIETQRDETGAYIFKGSCDKGLEQSCNNPSQSDPNAAFYTIWARYNYFRKTGDQDELAKIVRDTDTYYEIFANPDNKNLRQSTIWMCRMLFDIGHDDAFINQRQKLEYLCQNTWYAGAEMADVKGRVLSNQSIPEPEVETVEQNAALTYDPVINPDYHLNGFFWYAVTASNLLTQNQWFNDASLIPQAKGIYRKALQVYSQKKNDADFMKEGDAVIAISALDLYKATGQNKYLKFATTYISRREQREITNLNDGFSYLFLLHEIYKVSGDSRYSTFISQTISTLMQASYMSEIGAFRDISNSVDYYNVYTNAILAGILSNY